MSPEQLQTTLVHLISTWENELIEFKDANDNFSTSDIGKYFSALSNQANLLDQESAWLIFGVDNKTRRIIGTKYREDTERLQSIKHQISDGSSPSSTFKGVYSVNTEHGRVVMFHIPAAPLGIPIAWKGHYYSRSGESLDSLGLTKLDEIRSQTQQLDWSAGVVPDATVDHLDPEAVSRAKANFIKKHSNRLDAEEVNAWDTLQFLNKARIAIDGKITRAAILLLGKAESSHLLLPHPAQMTWKLVGAEQAYEHFSPPFILTSTQLYQRIRNIQIRILPNNDLLAVEVAKYDQKMLLEALHNCIAHQDYTLNSRIIVTETPDKIILENAGTFAEGTPEEYVLGNRTPRRYRNTFLTRAMAELNMIDTMGYGIHQIHKAQAQRFLPMPDYDVTTGSAVELTIYGSVVDEAYSQALIEHADLNFEDVLALDRVQKQLTINDESVKRLRSAGLIEGRKPNFHVSATIADAGNTQAEYLKTKGFDDQYYKDMIVESLKKFDQASRSDIDELLRNKLPDYLTEDQQTSKIKNLLAILRKKEIIVSKGTSKTFAVWKLNS